MDSQSTSKRPLAIIPDGEKNHTHEFHIEVALHVTIVSKTVLLLFVKRNSNLSDFRSLLRTLYPINLLPPQKKKHKENPLAYIEEHHH